MGFWLGVDLGTTFVAAAVVRDDGVPEMFTLGDRAVVAPAVVHLRDDGELLVAEAADRREVGAAERTAREFKRRLGDPTPVRLDGRSFQPTELMAALLTEVLRRVEEAEGESPAGVGLTHPANWGPFRRGLFEEVPRLAGLSAVHMVTEPEAAAYHYAATRELPEDAPIAVYDLGGGTFDAAVLRKRPGSVEVLGVPEGIERLGGVDFDNVLLRHVDYVSGGAVSDLDARDPRVVSALARLRRDCTLAKETLSVDTETVVPVFLPDNHFDVRVSREQFEDLIRAPAESTVGALEHTLRSAHLEPDDLAAVLLAGGSSRIPLVGQMVEAVLGRPIVLDTHPKYGVALGAATLAMSDLPAKTVRPAAPPLRSAPLPLVNAPTPDPGPSSTPPRWAWGKRRLAALALAAVMVAGGFAVHALAGGDPAGPASAGEDAPKSAAAPRAPFVVARIPVGGSPGSLALTRDGERLYGVSILRGTDNSVSWFACDTETNTKVAGGPLATGASAMAVSGDGHAYFSSSAGPEPVLAVVDGETGAETEKLRVGSQPSAIAFAPDGHRAYIAHGRGFVSLYDVNTRMTSATIPGFRKPIDLVHSPDGRHLYVSDNEANTVSVIDTAVNRVVANVPVARGPLVVVVSRDGTRVYVSSAASVAAIDTATNAVAWSTPVGSAPLGLAVSRDGRKLYVAQGVSSSVAVLDTSTHLIEATVAVGKMPGLLVISPDGAHLYVGEQDSGTISVIDTGDER